MRIVTYVWVGDEAPPEGADVIARIRCPMLSAKGKMVETWHPVVIHGRDEADARANAQAWWDAELDKERSRQEALKRAHAARHAKASV